MDFLTEIEKLLDMTSADKAEVMRELTAHFDELYDEFVASGMGTAQAQSEAAQRLGTPADIAARLNAAHNSASWKSALLCMVPFAAAASYLFASGLGLALNARLALLVAIGVIMLSASARELLRGRRPLWLATWLAAGLLSIPGVFFLLGAPNNGTEGIRAGAYGALWFTTAVLIVGLATRRFVLAVVISSLVAGSFAVATLTATQGQAPMPFASDTLAFYAMIVALGCMVLLVLFAKILFQTHTYGNALQAVLFLLGTFVIRLGEAPSPTMAWARAFGVILSALAVLWFTRAPRRSTKALACYLALFAYAFLGQTGWVAKLPDAGPLMSGVLSAAIAAAINHVIVVSPMLQVIRAEVGGLRLAR